MKNKIYKVLPIILYLLSFLILMFCVKKGLNYNTYLNINTKLMLLTISFIFIYIGGFLLVKKLGYDKKILKINLIIYFLMYIFIVCMLTLFDDLYGRNGLMIIEWDKELLDYYLTQSFNIIPFKTVKLFVDGYNNGIVNLKAFISNIFGNLVVFMPFAIFLPRLFDSMKKYWKFLIVMILIVSIIEVLQFVTLSGACDIDDLILNVFGASVMYFITKIKLIKKIINKVFYLE